MNEYDMIRQIAGAFPRHAAQLNAVHTCDAEVIRLGDALWALTLDEFSPEEDRFTRDDPETLGANLATATLSDLLAAGAEPAWYMHSLSLPYEEDDAFLAGLTRGISSVLAQAECALCGGDFGRAAQWRYCGFAMGRIAGQHALTRIIPLAAHTLWISGPLGDANMAALTGHATPRFELRLDSARLIREAATACIDTSGGLCDALWLLHLLNPGLCLQLAIDQVPLAAEVAGTARQLGIPPAASLLGGAGEYELLFTLPEDNATVERALRDAGAVPIGTVQPDANAEIVITRQGQEISRMTQAPLCPRAAASIDAYIRAVLSMAAMLFPAESEGILP
ncbi:MAG TPA: AIR synthase related protein [Armatimonadota bacterium]